MAYISRKIVLPQVWDSFVKQHAPMALFQSWQWGEVERRLGHTIWRWGWFEGGKLIAVAQIKKVSARRGTFLHVRHGPIVASENYWKKIHEDLIDLARKEKAWFIRISPQVIYTGVFQILGFVSAPIHAMDGELCWVLDLDKSEEEMLADMRKSTRYEIRRAQKFGVKVHRSIERKDLKAFHHLYEETSQRHGFVGHTGIDEEFSVFAEGHAATLYTATFEKKLLAAAIILEWGNEAIYHHGASISSKIPASYLIQWEAIREAKKRGKKVYNFWGIAPQNKPNHPWRGLTVFKTGFGGREVNFIHAQDYAIHPFYSIPKTVETIRRLLKGY